MNKIMIIGSPGSGKSTLSKALAKATGLPLYHLDTIYHLPGWKHLSKEQFDERLMELVSGPEWIIDGNYSRTLELRLAGANTVIWLRLPRQVCVWRVWTRMLAYRSMPRSDLAKGCPERLDREFLKFLLFTWRFPDKGARRIEQALSSFPGERRVIILQTDAEVRQFLADVGA